MAKVKGTNFIGLVKVLRTHRERALAVLPPALHRYLEERVLPSTWYPADDFLGLQTAMASVIPLGATPYFQMGRLSAQLDLGGIYKNHLKAGDPLRTLTSAQALCAATTTPASCGPSPKGREPRSSNGETIPNARSNCARAHAAMSPRWSC